MYSQNQEEQYILNFFAGQQPGTLLDIGANDGKTFSNSLALIEKGWSAALVEPSYWAFEKLQKLHGKNDKVRLFKCAIGNCAKSYLATLHESGAHLPDGSDYALLSSLKQEETLKWKGVSFTQTQTRVYPFRELRQEIGACNLDFITIDSEGMDIEILKQIDLSHTKILCIEWNSIEKSKDEILNYTDLFNMNKVIYQSPENLLITR